MGGKRVEYRAVLEYDEEEVEEFGLEDDNLRENMLDLIRREPDFGTIIIEDQNS